MPGQIRIPLHREIFLPLALAPGLSRKHVTHDRVSALYRQYGPVIYWRCLKLLGDEAAAEDATQETFLRVHRHLDHAPDADEALRWLWRIATNHCLNEVRNRKRRPEPTDQLPDVPSGVALEQLLTDRDLVAQIIGRVDHKLRAVAWVHYVDGLEHVEAGRVLGISRRTVANRLADFNDKARKILERLE
jgi:RNA polymerase sigma-70 factor (ECF subfamily)